MIPTPTDVKLDWVVHAKWDAKLKAMPLAKLRQEAAYVGDKGSTSYDMYAKRVIEELHLRERVWISHDGRRCSPKQMSDEHLSNAIGKIERERGRWRTRWLGILKSEVRRRRAQPLIARRILREIEEETMNGLFEPRE